MANGIRQTDANAVVQTDANGVVQTFIDSQFDVTVTGTNGPVAPGNNLDVTVDVTNSGTDQDTQDVTLDIDNSVGEVDRQSVTLSAGQTSTETLTWSVPSGQTEQDYQATVASDDDSAQTTVTVNSGTLTDDFEDGSLDTTRRWAVTNADVTPTESNGRLLLESTGSYTRVQSQNTFTGGVLSAEVSINSEAQGADMEVGFADVYLHKHQTENNNWRFEVGGSTTDLGSLGTNLNVEIIWGVGNRATLFINGSQVAQQTTNVPSTASNVIMEATKGSAINATTKAEFYNIELSKPEGAVLITSAGTAAPGENLNVTVDVANTTQSQTTQTITLDVDGVQEDSQSVTLSAGQSSTETLTWAVPSNQTEQDYQATVASNDDSATATVTVSSVTLPSSAIHQFDANDTASISNSGNTWNSRISNATLTGASSGVVGGAVNGKDAIRTDGVDDVLSGSFGTSVNRPYTVISVVELLSNDDLQAVYDNGPNSGKVSLQARPPDDNWVMESASFQEYNSTISSGNVYILTTAWDDNGVGEIWVNGSSLGAKDADNRNSLGGLAVGARATASDRYGDYHHCEHIVYDGFLNATTRSDEEDRLSNKWGVTL